MAQSLLERNPALQTPTLNGHPVLTDSFLLSLGKESFYIFCKCNPLHTDTSYAPLSVHINRVWLFRLSRFDTSGEGGEGYRPTTVVPSHFPINSYGPARQGLNRTKGIKTVGKTISSDQMDVHIVHTLTQKRQEERRQILHDIQAKELVTDISEGQASAMKADLGITSYCLNKLRRYVLT